MADWVRSHFGERLALAWRTVAADRARGASRRRGRRAAAVAAADPRRNWRRRRRRRARSHAPNFDPRYRFETFVVGKANEVAATAAQTLATADSVNFNPLFIHGGTGRGKTHLLHAIGHAFLAPDRGARVVSMSAEKFMVEFIRALKENDTIGFKQRLRSGRSAADRRRPVHRRQGFDPGRILPHDERDHHRRAAAGDHLGPRAAGPRRDRAAHPVAPVVGPGRRHQPGRLRASLQHHRVQAGGAAGRRDAAPRWSISSPAG